MKNKMRYFLVRLLRNDNSMRDRYKEKISGEWSMWVIFFFFVWRMCYKLYSQNIQKILVRRPLSTPQFYKR